MIKQNNNVKEKAINIINQINNPFKVGLGHLSLTYNKSF